jgi:hypothetical protein
MALLLLVSRRKDNKSVCKCSQSVTRLILPEVIQILFEENAPILANIVTKELTNPCTREQLQNGITP